MFKVLILLPLLFGAYGIVVILLRRVTDCSRQIGELHQELRRNDERLRSQIDHVHAVQEAQQKPPTG